MDMAQILWPTVLRDYFREKDIPFVFRAVNRLDADTEGCSVAKNRLAAAEMSRRMMAGQIEKSILLYSGENLKILLQIPRNNCKYRTM